MSSYCIKQMRINNVVLRDGYNIESIQIGIPVVNDEAKNIGLEKSLTSQSYTARIRAGTGLRCGRYTLSAHGVGASSDSTSTSAPLRRCGMAMKPGN